MGVNYQKLYCHKYGPSGSSVLFSVTPVPDEPNKSTLHQNEPLKNLIESHLGDNRISGLNMLSGLCIAGFRDYLIYL